MANDEPIDTRLPQIADEVSVGMLPAVKNTPAVPGDTFTVSADAIHEYVAGSRLQWYSTYPRALPWSIDDITTDFGADLYERMMLDAQVRAVTNVFKAAILETGVELTPAVIDRLDPDYDAASALCDRTQAMFDNLEQSIDDVLWDMLDGVCLGNRIAEQSYFLDTTHTGKQEYALQSLTVKPREAYAFVTDVYLNVLGILGRIPGQPFPVQQGTLLANIRTTTNFLPRSKFAVFTFRPRNADPRGTSLLRAAWTPWNAKQQLVKEYLKYLTQFATPSLVGFTAPDALSYALTNPQGELVTDLYGNPIPQSPEQDMLTALVAFANGTATAFPHGAAVQAIEMGGQGEAFITAFQFFDTQIAKAVLNQTLATEEGQHQTRASSSIHKDVLDTIIRQGKRPLERMLERDIIGTWLRLNGQEDLLRIRPKVTLGTSAQEDLASLWSAVAALQKSGYLHPSQTTELDRVLLLPERTPPGAMGVPETEVIQVKADGTPVVAPDTGNPPDQEGAPQPARPAPKPAATPVPPATAPGKVPKVPAAGKPQSKSRGEPANNPGTQAK